MRSFANPFARAGIWGVAAAVFIGIGAKIPAQQPPSHSVEIQRQAMGKLSFLAGHWSGPLTVVRGSGEPLHLTQTERVQFKLDGLVLLIEGRSTGSDGKAAFEALATIAYDDEAGKYRIRAFNDGRYLDTELTALADGFSWGFEAGPAHIVNAMRLTPTGQWHETTQMTMGNNPPMPSVDMMLDHEK
jgi:hypothetical protein